MAKRSIDRSVNYMLEHADDARPETVWERSGAQSPHCTFGEQGLCCRNCYMGPCRIKPGSKRLQRGVCGATAEVIVARNFARMIAGGAAAHSDHGRAVAKALELAAEHPRFLAAAGHEPIQRIHKDQKEHDGAGCDLDGRATQVEHQNHDHQ